MIYTIDQLRQLRESENKVEFKAAKAGSFSFSGGKKPTPKDRRHCIIGYVVALANEGGGHLVFGMDDKHPHAVVGTSLYANAVGQLEQNIYRETKIRPDVYELFDRDSKRVLVISVPGRPYGKVFKFEDVALMRVGEELLPMSDEKYLRIIQEQEPDFSAKKCEGATFEDLDAEAIQKLKTAYATKQENPQFLTLSDEQALRDLALANSGGITYAALILTGKESSIKRYLPQASIYLEYRNSLNQIIFDNRYTFTKAYFLTIDELWNLINQRNGRVPVQQGAFIFDIPYFNREVIREALNNAVAHRDYCRSSEVVIKQYPEQLHILNPGGFPLGVTIENLLTVSSTPRNRLLCEVLAKSGAVERSGQGIDKIFYQSISEAKPEPDYSMSDDFQVELRLSGIVEDKAFALFIRQIQAERVDEEKLSVQEVIALNRVRRGDSKESLDPAILKRLLRDGLVEKIGKTNAQRVILSKEYYVLTGKHSEYSEGMPINDIQINLIISKHLEDFGKAQMGNFVQLLRPFLTRAQVRYAVGKLVKDGFLDKKGTEKKPEYFIGKKMKADQKVFERAIKLGFQEMQRLGELKIANSPKISQKKR